MAEKPNKWTREESFFSKHGADIFTATVAGLCAIIFVILALTQWNMGDMAKDYFSKQAPSHPAPPQQPDIVSKPGETGMTLFAAPPAAAPKSPQNGPVRQGK